MTKYVIQNKYGLYFAEPPDVWTDAILEAIKYDGMTEANLHIIWYSLDNVIVEPIDVLYRDKD